MQERDFSIFDAEKKIRITGGILWQMPPREGTQMWKLDRATKTLSLYLQPNDELNEVKDGLFELIREHNWQLHLYFAVQKRVPSLLLMVPASLTIWLIAFVSLLGDAAIAVAFTEGEESTIFFGLNRFWLFLIMGGLATLMLYAFPAFFSGEQEGFVQYIYNRFSQRSIVRERFRKAFVFLRARGWVERIEIWNPYLGEDKKDWISQSLIPAILDARLGCELQLKIDERSAAQNFVAHLTRRPTDEIVWEEKYFDIEATKALPYEYLESWEKRLLAIYTFASTANLPNDWKAQGLKNIVSLPLVAIIVAQFKERLFAEEDRKQLTSLDTFASRCVNDFGVLNLAAQFSRTGFELWEIAQTIVDTELATAKEEMRYVFQFLDNQFKNLSTQAPDIVTALLANSQYTKVSTYSPKRLDALRYFIEIINKTELYKIFSGYWPLLSAPAPQQKNYSPTDIYRVLGVDYLIDLGLLFEKAAIYEQAQAVYDFIEEVQPYKGRMGQARISEKKGDYRGATEAMLLILEQYKENKIKLSTASLTDLNLNLSWAIVSGRLLDCQNIGLSAVETAKNLLYADFDQFRNSNQMVRLYNITANYEEWAGRPFGSIENYENALKIPGAEQWGLSNILVNKGIALRQVGRLAEGANFGEQGVDIKTAIGDADQLPIALHNLAQTYLLLAFSLPKTEQSDYFRAALGHAQTGLDIQARTGSVKKRGQLLAERYVATAALLPEDADTIAKCQADTQNWLDSEAAEGRQNTYDFKVVSQELMPMIAQL
jgi:hypothetical protein